MLRQLLMGGATPWMSEPPCVCISYPDASKVIPAYQNKILVATVFTLKQGDADVENPGNHVALRRFAAYVVSGD